MSILPAGMDAKPYSGLYDKDGALQEWQRSALESDKRGMDRQLESQTMPRVRPSMTSTIRTVTPDQLERGEDGSQLAAGTLRAGEYGPSSTQTSPRSMLDGDRRQGLVFQDSYSTESLESVRPGPPVSFHSRPRTRTTSGVKEHARHRSTSTSVSRSRHRIGSVHSTNASSFHNVEPRSATTESSTSAMFPPIPVRPTPPPQIDKSNSVKGGRRLVRRSSRPASPFSTTNDIPSVDSFPFPVATGDANKILLLMKTLCGRMRGEVEYQTHEQGSWHSGICYIDDVKASLMFESEDRSRTHPTLIPDLRGCRVRPVVSNERQSRCLEISNRWLGLELHLLPVVKTEYDLWLAALLCWQQIRSINSSAALSATAAQPTRERMSALSRRGSSQNYSNPSTSPAVAKDGNIIKVAKVLLWDKGAPSCPKAIVQRPSTRDSLSPARSWKRVSCILQDNGEFKLLTENDVTLLSVIQLSQLSRSAIQRLDKSVLDQDHCIAIFPRYTSSSTQLSIFRPVYIALESHLLYEVWFCLLIALSVPEIYGPSPTEQSDDSEEFATSEITTTPDMFRIEKSINLRIVEAKIRKPAAEKDVPLPGKRSAKPEDDPSVGEYFAEVVLDGEIRARTMTKPQTRNPFWREDYEFLDLPGHTPQLSVKLKRVENTVSSRVFFSSSRVFDQPEEALCGTVDISVDKLERGKDSEAWWPILDDLQEPIGEIFLKIRHEELAVLLAKDYEPISLLLHGFASSLTDQIAQYIPRHLRPLSEILMNIFQVSGHAGDWLMALVEEEIDGGTKETPAFRRRWSRRIGSNESFTSTSDREQTVRDIGRSLQGEANLLFRGNSLFTQAMDFHMRRVGAEYLRETLSDKVAEINTLNPDCEVDPSRMVKEEDSSKNWALLISFTTDIWEGIARSASRCPAELRQILKYIRAVAEDRYGDFFRTVSYTSVSGFLFLRFLCPALLNPKLFGLLRDHPQAKAQRTLTLIAKTLQVLANLSLFGQKEIWMEPMNRFLYNHRQGVKDFIDDICSLSAERRNTALPASYSTPITILARLPATSREGFPSLPYLIDHARNFAALVKLWLDSTSHSVDTQTIDGDLAEFNQLCIDLQRRTDECLQMAETGDRTVDQLSQSQQLEDLVRSFQDTPVQDEVPDPDLELGPMSSPPWAEVTTTITAGAPSASSSELTGKDWEKDKRERLSFWESAFGKESKNTKLYDTADSLGSSPIGGQGRNGNNKASRNFLSGLRRKGSTPGPF